MSASMNRSEMNGCACLEFAPLLGKWRFRGRFRDRARELVKKEIGYIHDASFSRLSYDDVREMAEDETVFTEQDAGGSASGRNGLPIYLQRPKVAVPG
ncbi:MAG: hypothetical protein ACF8TS_13195 [Maioricimonas sp. JB049]